MKLLHCRAQIVIATEVKRRGQCDLYIDQIAAFAGVGRTTARNAQRQAKRLGLILIDERRLSRRYNDANRITIISREWRAWLAHGRKESVKNLKPTYQPYLRYGPLNRKSSTTQAVKPAPDTNRVASG
jgi:hypothetical protein